jgi:hypothetical protein
MVVDALLGYVQVDGVQGQTDKSDGMIGSSLANLCRTIEAESVDGVLLLQNPQDNPICQLSYNKCLRCIEIVWRKHATSPQLRFIHEIIISMLSEHSADKILGDDSDLPIVHAEDQHWIINDWLPRARAAGLKAVATAVSMTFFGRLTIGRIHARVSDELSIKDFHSIHSARMWLKALATEPPTAPG